MGHPRGGLPFGQAVGNSIGKECVVTDVVDDNATGNPTLLPGSRGSTNGWPRGLLGDGAVLVVIASVASYVTGSGYLESYYSTLGLGRVEKSFDPAFVMTASIVPLLPPLIFLALLAVVCLSLRARITPPPPGRRLNPFYPIPLLQAITIVLGVWAIKLLSDFIAPPANEIWIAWSRRDVLFFLGAVATLAYVYWGHWKLESPSRTYFVRPVTASLVGVYVPLLVLVFSLWATSGSWPLSLLQSLLAGVGVAYTIVLTVRDWRRRERREAKTPDSGGHLLSGRDPSSTVFLGILVFMAFVFTGSLPGTLAAQSELAGCEPITSVQFEPPPPTLDPNGTYWLLLHHRGVFYVRKILPVLGDETYAVPAEGLTLVTMNRIWKLPACPQPG